VSLRSVGYTSRMAYCISLGRFNIKMSLVIVRVAGMTNDPFDPYGWLISLALRRVQLTVRILHFIRETCF